MLAAHCFLSVPQVPKIILSDPLLEPKFLWCLSPEAEAVVFPWKICKLASQVKYIPGNTFYTKKSCWVVCGKHREKDKTVMAVFCCTLADVLLKRDRLCADVTLLQQALYYRQSWQDGSPHWHSCHAIPVITHKNTSRPAIMPSKCWIFLFSYWDGTKKGLVSSILLMHFYNASRCCLLIPPRASHYHEIYTGWKTLFNKRHINLTKLIRKSCRDAKENTRTL